jgi:hypothetical protein
MSLMSKFGQHKVSKRLETSKRKGTAWSRALSPSYSDSKDLFGLADNM